MPIGLDDEQLSNVSLTWTWIQMCKRPVAYPSDNDLASSSDEEGDEPDDVTKVAIIR